MKKKILLFVALIVFSIAIAVFINLRYILPIKIDKQWTTPKISKNQELTLNFLFDKMSVKGDGIYTNYIDQPSSKDITKGHAILSESEGLIMLYAVEQGDKELFDKNYNLVLNKMLLKDNSVAWRTEKGVLADSSSTIDDLRIIKALIYAYDRWKSFDYRKSAIKISDSILKNSMNENIIVDFKDSNGKSSSTTICYLDVDTMHILSTIDRRWKAKYAEAREIANKAYISKELPLYRTIYDNNKKQFVVQKDADTLLSLITAKHLEENGQDINSTVNWIKEKMKEDGALYASYDINTGKSSTDIRSTAIYSVAASIAKDLKDKELYDELIKKLLEFQVVDKNSEIYGSFGNPVTKDVYSFDNLNAILAMQE